MTGTQLATRQNGAALSQSTAQQLWSDEQIRTLKQFIARGASDAQFALFAQVCQRTGLDPFAKQVYCVVRRGKDGPEMAIQISIDGLRLIAQRSAEYAGTAGPFWCDRGGVWTDVWLSNEPPAAAKVGVWRRGFQEPAWAVVTWREFAGATQFWKDRPAHMLAKVAESHALRKAFQPEMAGAATQMQSMGARVELAGQRRADERLLVDQETGELVEIAEAEYQPTPAQLQTPVEHAPAPPTGARRPVAAATVPPAVTAPAPTRQAQMATLELGAAIEAGELEDPEPSTEATQADEDPEHAEALRHYVAAANKAAQARLPHLSPAQVQERSTSEIQDQTTLLLDALNAPQAKARR